ncbi:MAG: hypothetical protein WCK75_09265, partial [Elusimicrobiota bacterium]
MKKSPVALLLVIDAVGITTIEHLLANYNKKVKLPNLSRLGFGEIVGPRFKSRFAPKHSKKSYAAALTQ